ncbi:MAG: Integrase [uncultured Thermomicrobiales bacterium]|uniref:Integrase n=1 Tax=uncultured Thermomicrobiales bacterium TaxID=1645740 RepID=A0A6J4VV20_9BACT|nr:MAG: Integrase [uncultured Thermomicrobiales bacterium]
MVKKANGEGSISQLPSGRWRVRVMVGGTRYSANTSTRKEAQQKYREFLGHTDRGLVPPTQKVTLHQHIERWLTDEVLHTRKPRTFESYRDSSRLYILPLLGPVKLAQLQPAHVQRLCSTLLEEGLSPKTVRIAHGVLHCALAQAVSWDLVPRNVASLAKAPRVKRKEIEALDEVQARQLMASSKETRWEALIAVALVTGLRQGELLGLKWSDIDLDRGVVQVQRQLGRDGTLADLKNDHQRRSIDVPPHTVTALRDHKRRQTEERLLLGPEYTYQELVFCTHRGRPLGHRNVSRAYKGLLKRASLPNVSFHALRHTNATLLLLAGVHPKLVQERLGHSNISMTLDIYSHVLPRLGREAADKLEALLA